MSITTTDIMIPGGTPGLNGYLAVPLGDEPRPALVIIHEIYGLNEDIRAIARRFAEAGYVALAVDLMAGRNRAACMFRFMTSLFLNSLNHEGIQNLKVTLTYLEHQPFVESGKLGAVGFCLGGGFAIAWACSDSRLRVIAPFYALNPRPLDAVQRACPIVGSYPQPDFSTGAGRALDAALERYNITHDIKFYPGSTHSFFNARRDSKPENQAAAEDTWQRVIGFVGEHING